MGISPNIGDFLTYYIYCEDTKRVISQSVIRTADPQKGGIMNKPLEPISRTLQNEPDKMSPNLLDSGENIMQHLDSTKDSRESTNSSGVHSNSTARKLPRLHPNNNNNMIRLIQARQGIYIKEQIKSQHWM